MNWAWIAAAVVLIIGIVDTFFRTLIMDVVHIKKSTRKGKKLVAEFPNGDKVHFGAVGYSDFTRHGDPKRKQRYLQRHQNDPTSIKTPGGLSRDLLWSRPDLGEAAKYASRKHNVKIVLDSHLR